MNESLEYQKEKRIQLADEHTITILLQKPFLVIAYANNKSAKEKGVSILINGITSVEFLRNDLTYNVAIYTNNMMHYASLEPLSSRDKALQVYNTIMDFWQEYLFWK